MLCNEGPSGIRNKFCKKKSKLGVWIMDKWLHICNDNNPNYSFRSFKSLVEKFRHFQLEPIIQDKIKVPNFCKPANKIVWVP